MPNKIFLVTAEPKLYDGRPFPITFFLTEEEAWAWIDSKGVKRSFWYDVEEVDADRD